MVGAQQAAEVVGEEALLKKIRRFEVWKIAHREVDFTPLKALAHITRRQCNRAYRSERRQRLEPLHDSRQEHHLADVGKGEGEGRVCRRGIEGEAGEDIALDT